MKEQSLNVRHSSCFNVAIVSQCPFATNDLWNITFRIFVMHPIAWQYSVDNGRNPSRTSSVANQYLKQHSLTYSATDLADSVFATICLAHTVLRQACIPSSAVDPQSTTRSKTRGSAMAQKKRQTRERAEKVLMVRDSSGLLVGAMHSKIAR
jgi:hypothetical protein